MLSLNLNIVDAGKPSRYMSLFAYPTMQSIHICPNSKQPGGHRREVIEETSENKWSFPLVFLRYL